MDAVCRTQCYKNGKGNRQLHDWREDRRGKTNSFLDLGPPFSYIALGTAVGFAGSSSSETSDTLICRKKPREFNAHRDGKRFIVKADDLLTAFLSLDSAFSAEMTLEILYIKNW
jgi:hypothetical protein